MSKKLKSKKELQEMSKDYFDAFEKTDLFLATGDGQFFTKEKRSAAMSHAKSIDSEVTEIKRPAAKEAVIIELPEGNPTKEGWTIPQIQEWLNQREVKFTKNSKEDKLLEQVEEYLKNQEAEQ